jgi:peptide deformylase
MKLPKILLVGSAVLRTPAAPVTPDQFGTKKLKALVSTMVATMRSGPGVGLAAPQIGVSQQIIVLEDREGINRFPLTAIINPKLRVVGPSLGVNGAGRPLFFEGCLSIPGYMGLVARDLGVEVMGVDPDGAPVRWEATGWAARILQHEIDHLSGTLFIEQMLPRSFCTTEQAKVWQSRPVAEIRTALGA